MLRTLAVGLGLLCAATLAVSVDPGSPRSAGAAAASISATRPDIIVFLTDDMRYDELARLPMVRKWLIDRGTTFTHAYSADSICCPARATLLTGKLAHNHRTLGNEEGSYGGAAYFYRYNDPRHLLPGWLQDRGYRTGWAGKLLNGRGDRLRPDPDWSYWNVPVAGFYHYDTGWTTSINGAKVVYRAGAYREVETRRAVLGRIRAWQPGSRPYFLMAAHLAPHNAVIDGQEKSPVPSPLYRGTVDADALRAPPATREKDRSDKPFWIAEHPRVSHFMRTRAARRIEALRSVDATVGAVARELKSRGALDHTLLIFTSDNGYLLGEHGFDGKNVIYEESIHIPLVVAGPGFEPGSRVRQTVSLADVTSAVRKASGATPRPGEDGLPLQAFAADPTYQTSRPLLLEGSTAMINRAFPVDAIGRFYAGVRWRHFVYVEYENGPREFYDLSQDPYELRNSFRQPGNQGDPPSPVQVRLAAWLAAHKNCVGSAECSEPVPESAD